MGRTQPSRLRRALRASASTFNFLGAASADRKFATAKPADVLAKAAGTTFESLEGRKLFSSLGVSGTVLSLNGDAATANRLLVWSKSSSEVTVKLNGVAKDFARSTFKTIVLNGGAKDDYFSVSNRVAKPAAVNGNGGNDIISVPAGTTVNDGSTTTPPPTTPPTPPPTGGVIPSDNSAAKPTAVIKTLGTTINAGQTVHVDALQTTLRAGSPITARYEWNFGDTGSDYNALVGFNAAHVYDKAGTYQLKLTVYNENRGLDTETVTITVQPAERKTIYVSNSGWDNNDGTTTSAPIKTWAKAVSVINGKSNYEILFAKGQTFDAAVSLVIDGDNNLISSYGTGAEPVIKFSGPKNRNVIIRDNATATNTTVKDLTFDSIWNETDGNQIGMPLAIKPQGKGFNVISCTFLNVGYAINANGKPDGLLVQDNTAPLVTGVRDYFLWAAGTDITVLGNTVSNVTREHVVRVSGGDAINLTGNSFTNLSRSSVDRYDVAKGSATIQAGSYAYLAGNTFRGATGVGPLGEADGLADTSSRFRYAVYEGNRTLDSEIVINHGAEHIALRNNIIEKNGGPGISIDGYSSAYHRGVVDLLIVNNTGLNSATAGRFIWVGGSASGIEVVDNLYLANNLATGSYGTAGIYVNDSGLASFDRIDNNVWPVPIATNWAEGGVNWVGTNPNDRTGYQNQAEWNAWAKVGDDAFQDTAVDSNFSPTDSSLAATTGGAYAGVFTDYYGAVRPVSGDVTAGAVET